MSVRAAGPPAFGGVCPFPIALSVCGHGGQCVPAGASPDQGAARSAVPRTASHTLTASLGPRLASVASLVSCRTVRRRQSVETAGGLAVSSSAAKWSGNLACTRPPAWVCRMSHPALSALVAASIPHLCQGGFLFLLFLSMAPKQAPTAQRASIRIQPLVRLSRKASILLSGP